MTSARTQAIRSGKGRRAHDREKARLRRDIQTGRLPNACGHCGLPFNLALHHNDPMALTADHPQSIATGGKLLGQALRPYHRRCNASRGTGEVEPIVEDAS